MLKNFKKFEISLQQKSGIRCEVSQNLNHEGERSTTAVQQNLSFKRLGGSVLEARQWPKARVVDDPRQLLHAKLQTLRRRREEEGEEEGEEHGKEQGEEQGDEQEKGTRKKKDKDKHKHKCKRKRKNKLSKIATVGGLGSEARFQVKKSACF